MIVREARPDEHRIWAEMLARLHPDQGAEEFEREIAAFTALPEPYVCFLAFTDGGEPVGMIDARVRNYAEGAPNLRAAYVEDLWVGPEHRRAGVARHLLAAVERWARSQQLDWLGSDTTPDNRLSRDWHRRMGFEEVEQLVVFGKSLQG